jgi:hypothetical protein
VVRIDLKIPAHLGQQVAADFFLPILEGREFVAVIQAAVASLSLVTDKFTATFLLRANFCTRRSNSAPFTNPVSDSSVRVSSTLLAHGAGGDRFS